MDTIWFNNFNCKDIFICSFIGGSLFCVFPGTAFTNLIKYALICGCGFYVLPIIIIELYINMIFQTNYKCTKVCLHTSAIIGLIIGFVKGLLQ